MRKTAATKRRTPRDRAVPRPHAGESTAAVNARLAQALTAADGAAGALCVHELWMRGEPPMNVEAALAALWNRAAATIPDWLPMRYVDWLPQVCEIAARCRAQASGRTHIYLVLLDYADSAQGPYGIYVGMSRYSAAARFDQHKAGIRAAGTVLKRGLEPLIGPVQHLCFISRSDAARIEEELAEALRAGGLLVKGGH